LLLLTLHHGDTLIDGPYSSVPRASCCPRWFVASQRRQVFALWVFGSFGLCLHSPWLCLGDVGGALRPCNNDGVSLVCRVVHGGSWRASDAEFLLCGSLALWVFVCIAPGFVSAMSVGPYGRAIATVSLSSVVLFTVVHGGPATPSFCSVGLWLFGSLSA